MRKDLITTDGKTFDSLDMPVFLFNKFKTLEEEYGVKVSIMNEQIKRSLYPDTFVLLKSQGKGFYCAIPNPFKKYKDFHKVFKPIIRGLTPLTFCKIDESIIDEHEKRMQEYARLDDSDEQAEYRDVIENYYKYGDMEFNKHCQEIIEYGLSQMGLRNTLYIGISTEAKIDDIRRELEAILKEYIKTKKARIRDDKWKYYLITYDLKSTYPNLSYDDISDQLVDAYPYIRAKEGSDYFDAKNCENFYKSACDLINGEYRKYLYLEK